MDAVRVEVVYRMRISVVSVQKGPMVSEPAASDALTIEVNLPVAHLGNEPFPWDHGESDTLEHDVGVDVKV